MKLHLRMRNAYKNNDCTQVSREGLKNARLRESRGGAALWFWLQPIKDEERMTGQGMMKRPAVPAFLPALRAVTRKNPAPGPQSGSEMN